jgi:hypothetical protein
MANIIENVLKLLEDLHLEVYISKRIPKNIFKKFPSINVRINELKI